MRIGADHIAKGMERVTAEEIEGKAD